MYKISQIIFRNLIYLTRGSEISILNKLRLKAARRFKPVTISFLGHDLMVSDAAGFVRNFEEIFINRCYEFETEEEEPVIIDCGANIGLSVIFFKLRYPKAKIRAFEPDPYLFKLLSANIKSFSFQDVELIQAAVWVGEGELMFDSNKGFSGRVGGSNNSISVKSIDLKKYINATIDFLKVDIEGAEVDVVASCRDSLINVRQMFVEYHSFPDEDQQLDKLLRYLSDAGFRYIIKEEVVPEFPYLKEQNRWAMDLQLGIFAYR